MSTKALSVVVATIIALSMVDMAAAVDFDWWNNSWHYRVNVTINTSMYNRTDWPIERAINFTELGLPGTFDNNSVRVVEYNGTTGAIISEIPSQFDAGENYDNATNAYGEVLWLLNGTRPENTMLYYYIYFDNADWGIKPAPDYTSDLGFDSFLVGGIKNFGLSNSKIHINVSTERGDSDVAGMYFANVSGTVLFDQSGDLTIDPVEYIRYYDNPDYYGYDFKDNYEVISEGPVRIKVRLNGSEKEWGTPSTYTGDGYLTKTYTIYKNSQWITIDQTFTSTSFGVQRTAGGAPDDGPEALALNITRTEIGADVGDFDGDNGEPYSWTSVKRNSKGLGAINLWASEGGFFANNFPGSNSTGIYLGSVVTLNNPGESFSELAAIYFNNESSHDPVIELRNRFMNDTNVTLGLPDERKTVIRPQTEYEIYNRNETINITGNLTLDTHNATSSANATITDPTGANTSINLTQSGNLFLGNYTLPLNATTGPWNLTVRVYDENDYLLNTSMKSFNVSKTYIINISLLNPYESVNMTMFANVSVRTIGSGIGISGLVSPDNISCAYYNDTTGPTNVTNVTEFPIGSGDYSLNWTAPAKGGWNITCNATKYNNSGTGSATFTTIIKNETVLSINLTTETYNVSWVTWTDNQTFAATFNVTNLEMGPAYAINVTLNTTSGWQIEGISNPYSCGQIGSYGECVVDFNVTVPEGTPPGIHNITANVTWQNKNGTINSSSDWINITVDSNPVLEIMQPSLNRTFAENTGGILGNFTVNSTGNDNLSFVNISCIPGSVVCDDFNPVFTPADVTNLIAGTWTNITVNITVPDGQLPGSYTGTVNASFGGVWDTIILNVTVNETRTWNATNVSSCYEAALPDRIGSFCEVDINNTGNVDLYFNVTPPYNSTYFENYTYSNETIFTVTANTSYRILFLYNTTLGVINQTNVTVYNIAVNDTNATPGDKNFTITLEVVSGPDLQFFNITPTELPQLDVLTINVTLTDRHRKGISWVNANITWPNGTLIETVNLTNDTVLTPGGTSNWSLGYTNTTLRGINLSVVVFTWDDGGGYVNSSKKNFTVYAKLVLDIRPDSATLSYEPNGRGQFYIYINDSNFNPAASANVSIRLYTPGGAILFETFNETTDGSGSAGTDRFDLIGTVGEWPWYADVWYYDAQTDRIVNASTSGAFLVDKPKLVTVTTDDPQYKGTNFPVRVYVTKEGALTTVAGNVTITLVNSSSDIIQSKNATLIGGYYNATMSLATTANSGSYLAKAVAYDGPAKWEGFTVFNVPDAMILGLSLDLSVGDAYKPGDLVSITAFLSDQNSQYISDANITLTITDPDNNATVLNMTAVNTTTPPKYIANFTLPDNATLGPYTVFGDVTYSSEYTADVHLFVVSETLYTEVSIDPVVYLNESMNISVTVLNPMTGQGIDPDNMTLTLYETEGGTLTQWKSFTKGDFTTVAPGIYTYSETVDGSTPTGSYVALLEIKEGSYRVWGMESFKIQARLVYDVVITSITDPVTEGGTLQFTVNITNMGEFAPNADVDIYYWIDNLAKEHTPRKIKPVGESDILSLNLSTGSLPTGSHMLYVSVTYEGLEVASTSKTFKIGKGGGGPSGPGGGGGGGGPAGIPKLSIVEFYPSEVHVERGGVTYLIVTAENLGGADVHDVSAYITGIPEEWFEIIKGEAAVLHSNESSDILVQIKIPENVTAQIVTLTVTATSTESSHERSIIMRIFSSRADLVYFEIESVKKTMRNSEDRALGALKEGKNVSAIMTKIDEARVEIRQAENYLSNHDYDKALGHLDSAREVLEHVNKLLELAMAEAGPVPTETPAPGVGIPTPVLIFVFFVIAALGGAVVYLAREKISDVVKAAGTPTVKKPKPRRITSEAIAQTDSLKTEARNVERLLGTMTEQHEKGLISDSTYKELKNRNKAKLKDIKSQLKKLGA